MCHCSAVDLFPQMTVYEFEMGLSIDELRKSHKLFYNHNFPFEAHFLYLKC